MGSFYMSCSITGYPFSGSLDNAIIIPILTKVTRERKYHRDGMKFFPFFVKGVYDDSAQFEIESSPIAAKSLSYIHKILSDTPAPNPEEFRESQLPASSDDFTWEMFFTMAHEQYAVGKDYRISYIAIQEPVFDMILSDYAMYGRIDDSIEGYDPDNFGYYGFELYLQKRMDKEDRLLKKIEIEKAKHQQIIDDPSATDSEKRIANIYLMTLADSMRSDHVSSEERCFEFQYLPKDYNAEEYRNTFTIRFLNDYLSGLNKPWQECLSSGQDIDERSFQVLRNGLNHLIVSARMEFIAENYINVDDNFEVFDPLDKKLIGMMDELKSVDVETYDESNVNFNDPEKSS